MPQKIRRVVTGHDKDGKAIVYIGFGSITVPDPPALTKQIVKAVLKSA